MAVRVWEAGLILLLVFRKLTCAEPDSVRSPSVCQANSFTLSEAVAVTITEQPSVCPVNSLAVSEAGATVDEGDEVSLRRALTLVHKKSHDYVALLFYASWCPFSGSFRPNFSILSTLYPSIPHFAIEESVIRPSTLSKYGVHGFPSLFLLNSTVRVRYHGSRTLRSLVAFYSDVTGLKTAPSVGTSVVRTGHLSSYHEKHNNSELENCPFSWARSPENLIRQETCLVLATAFVLLRLLYFIFPTLFMLTQLGWRQYVLNVRLRSLLEHPLAYLNRAMQLINWLKEPCKRSNLQEGAMNAKAWASKSLASVSLGDATSTSRVVPVS